MKWILVLLAILGIIVSSLALHEHYNTGVSPCDINERWDCGIVNHSPFALFFGVPVAIIGIAGIFWPCCFRRPPWSCPSYRRLPAVTSRISKSMRWSVVYLLRHLARHHHSHDAGLLPQSSPDPCVASTSFSFAKSVRLVAPSWRCVVCRRTHPASGSLFAPSRHPICRSSPATARRPFRLNSCAAPSVAASPPGGGGHARLHIPARAEDFKNQPGYPLQVARLSIHVRCVRQPPYLFWRSQSCPPGPSPAAPVHTGRRQPPVPDSSSHDFVEP